MDGQEAPRYVLPRFLPDLGVQISDGSYLLVQLFERKKKAYVRSAYMKDGVIRHPYVVSPLYVTSSQQEGIQDMYWFTRAGEQYILNNFSPLNIEVKDPAGNVLHTYSTAGEKASPPSPPRRKLRKLS